MALRSLALREAARARAALQSAQPSQRDSGGVLGRIYRLGLVWLGGRYLSGGLQHNAVC